MKKHSSTTRKYFYMLLFTAIMVLGIFLLKDEILKRFYPLNYSDYVFKYSKEYKLDPYLVFAVIRVESNFNPVAESKKGAKGLMQITSDTGEWISKQVKTDSNSQMLFDPEHNIKLGCWYLNKLIGQFNGNVTLALAAYNGGSGNVSQWLKNSDYSHDGQSLHTIPFGETDRYIQKVRKDYNIYKSLYDKRK